MQANPTRWTTMQTTQPYSDADIAEPPSSPESNGTASSGPPSLIDIDGSFPLPLVIGSYSSGNNAFGFMCVRLYICISVDTNCLFVYFV